MKRVYIVCAASSFCWLTIRTLMRSPALCPIHWLGRDCCLPLLVASTTSTLFPCPTFGRQYCSGATGCNAWHEPTLDAVICVIKLHITHFSFPLLLGGDAGWPLFVAKYCYIQMFIRPAHHIKTLIVLCFIPGNCYIFHLIQFLFICFKFECVRMPFLRLAHTLILRNVWNHVSRINGMINTSLNFSIRFIFCSISYGLFSRMHTIQYAYYGHGYNNKNCVCTIFWHFCRAHSPSLVYRSAN